MADPQEYLGTGAQRTLLRRGHALFDLIRDRPQFTYYGRTVGVFSPEDAPLDQVIALARLQGNSNFGYVANDRVAALGEAARAQGLQPMHYARWVGTGQTLEAALRIMGTRSLPEGLRAQWLTRDTAPEICASLADMALSCGVLPPNLAVLRGDLRPGACLMAIDAAGAVVSCAAAAAFAHEAHPAGKDECWWGMLATRDTARGQGLSLRLGAEVIVEMNRRYGFGQIFTGVEPGNAPSEAVCARLDLRATDFSILAMTDPDAVPGGRMTK